MENSDKKVTDHNKQTFIVIRNFTIILNSALCIFTALGHELFGDDLQHFIGPVNDVGREALFHSLHHDLLVGGEKTDVIIILFREHKVIFAPVGRGIFPFQIPFSDKTVDLIGGVGLGDIQKLGKLTDGGAVQHLDDFERKSLHGRQRPVSLPYQLKNLAVKLELEFIVYFFKVFVQHRCSLHRTLITILQYLTEFVKGGVVGRSVELKVESEKGKVEFAADAGGNILHP